METKNIQLTNQRRAVLEAVRESHGHVDAAAVFDVVRERLPRISLGTVYRALGSLSESGMLYEISVGSGPALYDANLTPHQHVVCRRCGKVRDLDLQLSSDELDSAAKRSGFAYIECSRIDFHGICEDCSD